MKVQSSNTQYVFLRSVGLKGAQSLTSLLSSLQYWGPRAQDLHKMLNATIPLGAEDTQHLPWTTHALQFWDESPGLLIVRFSTMHSVDVQYIINNGRILDTHLKVYKTRYSVLWKTPIVYKKRNWKWLTHLK